MSSNPYELEIAAELYDKVFTEVRDLSLILSLAREAGGPILELACGTGRCILPLIESGFDVVGIDSSQAMLERLRRKTDAEPDDIRYRSTPLLDDSRTFLIPLRFGMAFIAANSFLHLLTKEDQELFAANVFSHLRPGGLLVIDVFNPDLGRLLKPQASVLEVGAYRIGQSRRDIELAEQTMDLITTYHHEEELIASVDWSLRYVFRFELEHLLEKAGYTILHLWGDYDRRAFGEATERLFVVAQKPPDADMTVVQIVHAEVSQRV